MATIPGRGQTDGQAGAKIRGDFETPARAATPSASCRVESTPWVT